jgi:hypothetical protein
VSRRPLESARFELAPDGLFESLRWRVPTALGESVTKVELYEKIRLAARDEGLGIGALERRFKVHRRDVRAALAYPISEPRKRPVRMSPVSGLWRGWVCEILVADRSAPVKLRHTAARIRDRLAAEKQVVVSPFTVRKIVAELRAEVAVEYVPVNVFVPQTRLPGATLLGDPFRFATESKFARWCSTGAVALSSGEGKGMPFGHRLDFGGNRRINSVLYIASVTPQRDVDEARVYIDRKISEGKTRREARRSHKRHLANRVIRRMWQDEKLRLNPPHQIAA